jgi:hypothetical protein
LIRRRVTLPRLSRPAGRAAPGRPAPRFLVIVERAELALYAYLRAQFAGDADVTVLMDRRRTERAETRPSQQPEVHRRDRRNPEPLGGGRRFCWVVDTDPRPTAVVATQRSGNGSGRPARGRGTVEALEDRQRVDRWIEESQYLIGRIIPGLMDDRERLKGKFDAAEHECLKLRHEVGELRKQVSDLQSETQYFRNEHMAMAEMLREVIEHVGQVQKPLNDVFRRLQVTQPTEVAG